MWSGKVHTVREGGDVKAEGEVGTLNGKCLRDSSLW